MNSARVRLNTLADLLETLPGLKDVDPQTDKDVFSMHTVNHACGTPACISGWYTYIYPENDLEDDMKEVVAEFSDNQEPRFIEEKAHSQTNELIIPGTWQTRVSGGKKKIYKYYAPFGAPGHITSKHAANCIRCFLKWGEVSWEKSKKHDN